MSARASHPLPDSRATTAAASRGRLRGAAVLAAAGALLLAGGCADLPRDANGSPPTARLAPNTIPPARLTAEQRQKLDTLNQEVLREQADAIARQQQAAAYARAAYPNTSWSLFYGGWGGWGGGVSVGMPGYWGGWGYPYWW
ncbi:hypothetical protein PO002_05290 [Cupriavidus necator]|uniref:hypothetical protein n=1 Tax=Cupriavidus necator TaxID=106590 RepID=UPI0039C3DC58